MEYIFWLALCIFVTMVAVLLEITWGLRQMTHIKDVPVPTKQNMPMVSIIIPACNEETTIEPALTSVLSLDYPHFEVIVMNDRSTDKTGSVLSAMQEKHPQLKIYNIEELPAGWLGKNHALHFGAARASGEYLLFTDADIVMEKTVLQRAMHHMQKNQYDHVSMFFENKAEGGLLNALFVDTGGALLWLFKPWKAKNMKSRHYMGVGAFNLVKKNVYQEIGGHEKVAMHPIDDVMLGKIIKRQGYRQDCLSGYGFITVQWYGTIGELIDGLMKNTFAVFNYNVPYVTVSTLVMFVAVVVPPLGFFFTHGATQLLCSLTIIVRLFSVIYGASISRITPWCAPWSLISPFISLYIIVRATGMTLINRGITWRGTFYPLDELKANRV